MWDEANIEHLGLHGVSPREAEQVFFNRYLIAPNKKQHGPKRYRIDGVTDSGRRLRLIFEDKAGWDL